jgi:hypothetical protein
MATPLQYGFDLAELTKALIKEQGIHDGKWMVAFEFSFGVGLFGVSPAEVAPGGFWQVKRALLVQPAEAGSPAHLVLDAAEVNPLGARPPQGSTRKKSLPKA